MAFAWMDVKTFTLLLPVFGIMPALSVRLAHAPVTNADCRTVCDAARTFREVRIHGASYPPEVGGPAGEGIGPRCTFEPAPGQTQAVGRT
jgi:hypothetical protein